MLFQNSFNVKSVYVLYMFLSFVFGNFQLTYKLNWQEQPFISHPK